VSDVGIDLNTPDGDLDPEFAEVSGTLAVCQALLRRYTTPLGGLFYDPRYGCDVRSYLGAGLTPARRAQLVRAMTDQAYLDERVDEVSVSIVDGVQGAVTITVEGLTGEGLFRLVMAASAELVTALSME
jgi:phage baseplate assembly protein W